MPRREAGTAPYLKIWTALRERRCRRGVYTGERDPGPRGALCRAASSPPANEALLREQAAMKGWMPAAPTSATTTTATPQTAAPAARTQRRLAGTAHVRVATPVSRARDGTGAPAAGSPAPARATAARTARPRPIRTLARPPPTATPSRPPPAAVKTARAAATATAMATTAAAAAAGAAAGSAGSQRRGCGASRRTGTHGAATCSARAPPRAWRSTRCGPGAAGPAVQRCRRRPLSTSHGWMDTCLPATCARRF